MNKDSQSSIGCSEPTLIAGHRFCTGFVESCEVCPLLSPSRSLCMASHPKVMLFPFPNPNLTPWHHLPSLPLGCFCFIALLPPGTWPRESLWSTLPFKPTGRQQLRKVLRCNPNPSSAGQQTQVASKGPRATESQNGLG